MNTVTRLFQRLDSYTLWAFNPDAALDRRRDAREARETREA